MHERARMKPDDRSSAKKKLLPLHKETLRNLARAELRHVAGGSSPIDETMGNGGSGVREPTTPLPAEGN
jgi:hypothetical protein